MRVKKQEKKIQESREYLKDIAIQSILDKKGEQVVSLDLRQINESVTDYFIICEASSTTQIKAIADNVIEKVKVLSGEMPWHKEGMENLEWVLIDYVSLVVHVFLREKRSYYMLEELWADAVATEHNDA